MAFEQLSKSRYQKRSSIIAAQIVEKIRSGEYRVGEKLPPERVIAAQMEVSRPSVREALSALHIVGIVESRPGDGTYVCDPHNADEVGQAALNVLEHSDSPMEILTARKALEIGIVQLAITEATEADINQIKTAWNIKYHKGLQGDYRAFLDYAKDFHLAIAKAAKNGVLERMLATLLDATRQPLWFSMRRAFYEQNSAAMAEVLKVHNDIVEAIEARDTSQAIAAMENHFNLLVRQAYA